MQEIKTQSEEYTLSEPVVALSLRTVQHVSSRHSWQLRGKGGRFIWKVLGNTATLNKYKNTIYEFDIPIM